MSFGLYICELAFECETTTCQHKDRHFILSHCAGSCRDNGDVECLPCGEEYCETCKLRFKCWTRRDVYEV